LVQRIQEGAPCTEITCLPDSELLLDFELTSGVIDLVWDWITIEDPDQVVDPIFEDRGYCWVRKNHSVIDDE
jgi:hypothetical protein